MDATFVDPERWQAWDRFVESRDDAGFMQTSWWVRFRETVGFDHFGVVLRSDGQIVGGALVSRWSFAPGYCFYYIQDGPLLPLGDEVFARQVFEALLDRIEAHRRDDPDCVSHLRIEPRWAQGTVAPQGFEPPAFDDIYREPQRSLWLDLRGDDDALLAGMKPKGRYNVRVAMRHGVTIEPDDSPRGLDDFVRLYRGTMKRNGLGSKPQAYFRALFSHATPPPVLLFAQYRGRRIATALMLTCGRRATYFYGGSLRLHKHTMAPYLLHVEAARRARAAGCDWYDLWGVSPRDETDHAWHAISEFKRKLGGVEIDRGSLLDRVYDAGAYARFRDEGRPPPPRRPSEDAQPAAVVARTDAANGHAATFDDVKVASAAVPRARFAALRQTFPDDLLERLHAQRFPFFRTTFWYPFDRAANHVVEQAIDTLRPFAAPSQAVIGVEWWLSVTRINTTPQWLLPCHFDRDDLREKDAAMRHPEKSSVLFLSAVPYGELVVTDQVNAADGRHPRQPQRMHFVRPRPNRYVVFPGHLYHGVLGRLWRAERPDQLRVSLAVNWWAQRPRALYMGDSIDGITAYAEAATTRL